MQVSTPAKKGESRHHDPIPAYEMGSDLRFITDLGRSLLPMVHPKKVANRIVDAVVHRVGGVGCVFAAEVPSIGLISSTASGTAGDVRDLLDRRRLDKWLSFLPQQAGYVETDKEEFLIADTQHIAEYL